MQFKRLAAKAAKAGIFLSTTAAAAMTMTVQAFADDDTTTTTSSSSMGFGYLILLILLFVVMYLILIRPQRKKDKEAKAMQNSLQIGDEIVTIGGIVGIVVQVSSETETIVIETTGNKNKVRLKNWAVSENVTVSANSKREQEEKAKVIQAKKNAKAEKKRLKKAGDAAEGDAMLKD